jgi:hypothetical protein
MVHPPRIGEKTLVLHLLLLPKRTLMSEKEDNLRRDNLAEHQKVEEINRIVQPHRPTPE